MMACPSGIKNLNFALLVRLLSWRKHSIKLLPVALQKGKDSFCQRFIFRAFPTSLAMTLLRRLSLPCSGPQERAPRFPKTFRRGSFVIFSLIVYFIFNLLFASLQMAIAGAAARWNKFTQKFITEFTLDGIVSSSVIASEDGSFWTFIKDLDRDEIAYYAHIAYSDGEITIIDSTHAPYMAGSDPHIGLAAIEVDGKKLIVYGSYGTVYVRKDNGEILAQETFDLQGQTLRAPVLQSINDKEFYIIIPTYREYIEGQQSWHDIYIYVFVYNAETETLDFAPGTQPIFTREKASLGQDGLALYDDQIFFNLTFSADYLQSTIFAVNIHTGQVLWSKPLGLSMTTGPSAAQNDSALIEVTAGAFMYAGDTLSCRQLSFFDSDGNPSSEPFLKPGYFSSDPIYTDGKIIFTINDGYGTTLYILDGRTKEIISEKYLGTNVSFEFITVDIGDDGLIEIIYRTREYTSITENKLVILHLDKEGHIIDNASEEIPLDPNKSYRAYGPLLIIEMDGRLVLLVGAKYIDYTHPDRRTRTDIKIIDLGPISTEGTWSMPNYNEQNTRCYGVLKKEPVPIEGFPVQNYPNPFGEETNIVFTLRESADVEIRIYNTLGQKVRTLVKKGLPKGEHGIVWDGRNENGEEVGSGIYLLKIDIDGRSQIVKVAKVK